MKLRTDYLQRTVIDNPFIPWTPNPKQAAFLTEDRREILYGGAAGGGKSVSLLMAALQYVATPGYSALLLRRTFADLNLPEALVPMSHQWLQPTAAAWDGQKHQWRFPGGGVLQFGYLETELDKYRYQGAAFAFCIARDTRILMADGSYRPVQDVRAGDWVATLEGAKPVTRRMPPRVARGVRIRAGGSETVVSEDHRILTEAGWVCPLERKPTLSHAYDSRYASSGAKHQASHTQHGCLSLDPGPMLEPWRQRHLESSSRANGVSATGAQTDFAGSDGLRQGSLPPRAWYGRAVLFERAIHQGPRGSGLETHPHARAHANGGCVARGCPFGCRYGSGCDGGRFRGPRESVPICIPSQGDAEDIGHRDPLEDDLTRIRERSPADPYRYCHPYTMEPRDSLEAVRLLEVETARVGVVEVYDLTVAGASHYVSYGGIISQNCGFDELTQFTEAQYRYLFSRLRKPTDLNVPLRMRAASNPGGVGHDWVKRRFVDPLTSEGRQFIPARLEDNPQLDAEAYDQSLNELDPITRAQLRSGDWNIVASAVFKREWFRYYEVADGFYLLGTARRPIRISDCNRFATMDVAGTEKQTSNDPDYSVIQIWDSTPTGDMILVEQVRGRFEIPAAAEHAVNACRRYDVAYILIEKNGIGLGVVQTVKGRGIPVRAVVAKKDKIARSQSAQIRMEAGTVYFPLNVPWLEDLEAELLAFGPEAAHDDQVDALSYAARYAARMSGQVPQEGDTTASPVADELAEREHKQQQRAAMQEQAWVNLMGDED